MIAEPAARPGRRRWQRSAWTGGALGLVLQFWMLTAGTWNLLRWERTGDFYDAQARSLLHGRLAVDERILGIESFARDGETYMYFGPVPALLRIPVIALTNRLDGRLSALSMLLALTLILGAIVALGWRLRELIRGDRSVGRAEAASAFLVGFGAIGASSLVFAASRTWVYHEAIMWGVALTLWSWIALLRWLHHEGRWWLAAATGLAALAMLTRPSVGGAAVAALGWVVVRRAAGVRNAIRPLTVAVVAMVAPVLAYAAVNWLKFRQLFSVPFDQQGFTLVDPQRQAMLEANNGNYFSPANVPTNLAHYLRPDAPRLGTRWPFVHFSPSDFTIGDRTYDLIDATAGVPVVMPLSIVAAVFACWAIGWGRRVEFDAVRPLLAGGVIGTFPVLGIAYIANRYHSDFLPLVLLLILVAVPVAFDLAERRSVSRRVVVVVLSVLTLLGTLANVPLAYTYQRAYSPNAGPDRLAAYVDAQRAVASAVGEGRGDVSIGDELPSGGRLDDVFIVGECDALYWSDGLPTNAVKLSNWNGVERQNGVISGTIRFAEASGVQRTLLVTTSDGDKTVQLPARIDAATVDRSGQPAFVVIDHDRGVFNFGIGEFVGPDVALPIGSTLSFGVIVDPRVGIFEVTVDGQVVVTSGYFGGDRILVATESDAAVTIDAEPVTTPVCERLLRDAQDTGTGR